MTYQCFYIATERPQSSDKIYVGEIDGTKATTIPGFLNETANAFKFPEYFGNNLDALDECLNDLSWIDYPNYILFIRNYNVFLRDENFQTKLDILVLLREVCNEWANVPNFEGENNFRNKADFKIYFEQCNEVDGDLKALPS